MVLSTCCHWGIGAMALLHMLTLATLRRCVTSQNKGQQELSAPTTTTTGSSATVNSATNEDVVARGVSDAPAMANANGHDHGIDLVPGLQSTPPRPKLCLSLKVCMRRQTHTHLRLNFALILLSQLFTWFIMPSSFPLL